MGNIVQNIKDGQTDGTVQGFELAQKLGRKHLRDTGRTTRIRRILDYIDQFNGRDREHWSFDLYED